MSIFAALYIMTQRTQVICLLKKVRTVSAELRTPFREPYVQWRTNAKRLQVGNTVLSFAKSTSTNVNFAERWRINRLDYVVCRTTGAKYHVLALLNPGKESQLLCAGSNYLYTLRIDLENKIVMLIRSKA